MAKHDMGLKRQLRNATKEERAIITDGLPYEIGFAKPPQATQFSSDRQPARGGRPKGSENLASVLKQEADRKIEVVEDGRRRKLSKRRVASRQLMNKAASGDVKAFTTYVDVTRKAGDLEPGSAQEQPVLDARDIAAILRLAAVLALRSDDEDPENNGGQS
jgi:hypothetical protein